jgi:hypothetical protein
LIKSLNKKIENQLQNNNKKDRIINFEKFNIFSRNNLTNETIFLKDNIDILLDEKIKNYNQDKHDIRNNESFSNELKIENFDKQDSTFENHSFKVMTISTSLHDENINQNQNLEKSYINGGTNKGTENQSGNMKDSSLNTTDLQNNNIISNESLLTSKQIVINSNFETISSKKNVDSTTTDQNINHMISNAKTDNIEFMSSSKLSIDDQVLPSCSNVKSIQDDNDQNKTSEDDKNNNIISNELNQSLLTSKQIVINSNFETISSKKNVDSTTTDQNINHMISNAKTDNIEFMSSSKLSIDDQVLPSCSNVKSIQDDNDQNKTSEDDKNNNIISNELNQSLLTSKQIVINSNFETISSKKNVDSTTTDQNINHMISNAKTNNIEFMSSSKLSIDDQVLPSCSNVKSIQDDNDQNKTSEDDSNDEILKVNISNTSNKNSRLYENKSSTLILNQLVQTRSGNDITKTKHFNNLNMDGDTTNSKKNEKIKTNEKKVERSGSNKKKTIICPNHKFCHSKGNIRRGEIHSLKFSCPYEKRNKKQVKDQNSKVKCFSNEIDTNKRNFTKDFSYILLNSQEKKVYCPNHFYCGSNGNKKTNGLFHRSPKSCPYRGETKTIFSKTSNSLTNKNQPTRIDSNIKEFSVINNDELDRSVENTTKNISIADAKLKSKINDLNQHDSNILSSDSNEIDPYDDSQVDPYDDSQIDPYEKTINKEISNINLQKTGIKQIKRK